MRHFFCVIRIGEPALRGCGKPTLIGSHAHNRPRHRGVARAIGAHSQQAGNHDYGDNNQKTPTHPTRALTITSGTGIPATDEAAARRRAACTRATTQKEKRRRARRGPRSSAPQRPQIPNARLEAHQEQHNSTWEFLEAPNLTVVRQLWLEHPTPGAPNYGARSTLCS